MLKYVTFVTKGDALGTSIVTYMRLYDVKIRDLLFGGSSLRTSVVTYMQSSVAKCVTLASFLCRGYDLGLCMCNCKRKAAFCRPCMHVLFSCRLHLQSAPICGLLLPGPLLHIPALLQSQGLDISLSDTLFRILRMTSCTL